MKVRVTIHRMVEEYLDVYVTDAESVRDGVARVEAQLAAPATRARMLNKQTWMRGETSNAIKVVESTNAD